VYNADADIMQGSKISWYLGISSPVICFSMSFFR